MEKKWKDQELFTVKDQESWGHEQLMLGHMFKRTLEQAANKTKYQLVLYNFRVSAIQQKSGNPVVTCWKANKDRFLAFVRHCGREKQFAQSCRVSTLEKQHIINTLVKRLAKKWEEEQNMPNANPDLQP